MGYETTKNDNLRQITALLPATGLVFLGLWLVHEGNTPRADQIGSAAAFAGRLVLLAVFVGVAAMASVQFWKAVFHPRGAFHAAQLDKLFGDDTDRILGVEAPKSVRESRAEIHPGLVRRRYLLDNPTEVVMGQIRSTADYILLRPEGFDSAIAKLAGPAGAGAAASYAAARAAHAANDDSEKKATTAGPVNDALVALRFYVEQHLNVVHTMLRERWRHRVRIAGAAVAGFIGLIAISLVKLDAVSTMSVFVAATIWGGFFSWLARDLVSVVERARG